jgi:hypothetical protein
MNDAIISEIESQRLQEPLESSYSDCTFYEDGTCLATGDGYQCEERKCQFKIYAD